jgi:hypothetical protein
MKYLGEKKRHLNAVGAKKKKVERKVGELYSAYADNYQAVTLGDSINNIKITAKKLDRHDRKSLLNIVSKEIKPRADKLVEKKIDAKETAKCFVQFGEGYTPIQYLETRSIFKNTSTKEFKSHLDKTEEALDNFKTVKDTKNPFLLFGKRKREYTRNYKDARDAVLNSTQCFTTNDADTHMPPSEQGEQCDPTLGGYAHSIEEEKADSIVSSSSTNSNNQTSNLPRPPYPMGNSQSTQSTQPTQPPYIPYRPPVQQQQPPLNSSYYDSHPLKSSAQRPNGNPYQSDRFSNQQQQHPLGGYYAPPPPRTSTEQPKKKPYQQKPDSLTAHHLSPNDLRHPHAATNTHRPPKRTHGVSGGNVTDFAVNAANLLGECIAALFK